MNIEKDYFYLVKVLRNKENRPSHIPALKNMIVNFEKKYPLQMSSEIRFLRMYVKQINKS
tara:strand:+ start:4280 stop:4459 length:180 start_codon:yes stop_codon:yes gene_type:complete